MLKTTLLSMVILLLTPAVLADPGGEREALARLVHELETLTPLLDQAEQQADVTARIRFQYGWLKQDLDRIKLGIRAHLNAPRAEPRSFPPLKGDYRR